MDILKQVEKKVGRDPMTIVNQFVANDINRHKRGDNVTRAICGCIRCNICWGDISQCIKCHTREDHNRNPAYYCENIQNTIRMENYNDNVDDYYIDTSTYPHRLTNNRRPINKPINFRSKNTEDRIKELNKTRGGCSCKQCEEHRKIQYIQIYRNQCDCKRCIHCEEPLSQSKLKANVKTHFSQGLGSGLCIHCIKVRDLARNGISYNFEI